MHEDRPAPPPPPQAVGAPPTYPAYAQPPRDKRPAWFWILIIGGCCAVVIFILLIIAALTIPQMLAAKKHANETSAVQAMRSIGEAEMAYDSAYPDTGFGCPLATLGGDPASGPPTVQAAQLIEPTLAASGQKAGYTFTVTCSAKITVNGHDVYTSYKVTAVPQSVGKTGDNGYCSDENNFIKFDPDGGTNCR